MTIGIEVRDTDLLRRHPNLEEDLWPSADDVIVVNTAIADSGTNAFAFNSEDISYGSVSDWDTYCDDIIDEFVIIDGESEPWRVTAATNEVDGDNYDISVTVENPDYVDDVSNTDTSQDDETAACTFGDGVTYRIQIGGYSAQIGEAFRALEDDLINQGLDLSIGVTRSFREAQICKTFELIFFDFFREEGDRWWIMYKEYQSRYKKELKYAAQHDDSGPLYRGIKRVL
jgi:hypothetical protein